LVWSKCNYLGSDPEPDPKLYENQAGSGSGSKKIVSDPQHCCTVSEHLPVQANADVIAHEIAHSWTGNLVTNKSFEHFWLNEGFTVFVERKIKERSSEFFNSKANLF
jgi:aminopeptidase N